MTVISVRPRSAAGVVRLPQPVDTAIAGVDTVVQRVRLRVEGELPEEATVLRAEPWVLLG